MVLNIVIARKGTGVNPIECRPITRVIECPDGADAELIAEESIDGLAAEHGISDHLWGRSTTSSMEQLVDGFKKYFDWYERRRCAS